MLLSTNTSDLAKRFGYKEAIRVIAKAGFDAYDMSYFDMMKSPDCPFDGEDYREYSAELRKYADSLGIICNQAHAPFPSSVGEEAEDEKRFDAIVRSMESAAILGCKYIVVHPCQHITYAEKGNPEKLREINIAFYKRLIPYCEKFGISIATENMWQWDNNFSKIVHSTCSRPSEFADYIDSIGSPYLAGCLDIGHTALVSEDIEDFITALGNKRLKALHVHDVDGHSDLHTLPFISKIDWERVLAALKRIGYDGDLTFEAGGFYRRMPDELAEPALRFMCETGRYLISRIVD